MSDFQKEWAILHNDIEKYEKFSIVIKLFSVLISVLCISYILNEWVTVTFILILWLQDGIWKTFQKRLEARILFIEKKLNHKVIDNDIPFQFYSQWENKRQGIKGLLIEYISNSAKPTVAYPYFLLIVLTLIVYKLAIN